MSGLDSVLESFLPPKEAEEEYSGEEDWDDEYEGEEDYLDEGYNDGEEGEEGGGLPAALPRAPPTRPRIEFEDADDGQVPNPLQLKPRPAAARAKGAGARAGGRAKGESLLTLPAHREVVRHAAGDAAARLAPHPHRFDRRSAGCVLKTIVASVGARDVAAWRAGAGDCATAEEARAATGIEGDQGAGGERMSARPTVLGSSAVCAVVALGSAVPDDLLAVGTFLLVRDPSALRKKSSPACDVVAPAAAAAAAATAAAATAADSSAPAPEAAPAPAAGPAPTAGPAAGGCFASLLIVDDVAEALADGRALCRVPEWLVATEEALLAADELSSALFAASALHRPSDYFPPPTPAHGPTGTAGAAVGSAAGGRAAGGSAAGGSAAGGSAAGGSAAGGGGGVPLPLSSSAATPSGVARDAVASSTSPTSYAVLGCGAMGVLAVACLRHLYGAAPTIYAVDDDESRRSMAVAYGASASSAMGFAELRAAHDARRGGTLGGLGCAGVIVATCGGRVGSGVGGGANGGERAILELAAAIVAEGGTLALPAAPPSELPPCLGPAACFARSLTLCYGGGGGGRTPGLLERAFEVLKARPSRRALVAGLGKVVTHRMPFAEAQRALELTEGGLAAGMAVPPGTEGAGQRKAMLVDGPAQAKEEGGATSSSAAPAMPFLKVVLYPDDEGSVLPAAVEASQAQGAAGMNGAGRDISSAATGTASSGPAAPASVLPRTAATLVASLD